MGETVACMLSDGMIVDEADVQEDSNTVAVALTLLLGVAVPHELSVAHELALDVADTQSVSVADDTGEP